MAKIVRLYEPDALARVLLDATTYEEPSLALRA